ncbi:TetR/AcrR family transcriptional regulator [Amycolatopsis nigrescens]|uniref:TetR/AcrR family transcriptional regulator n=1 Tax=Amycolatopsis nigrescens TaxID=381445 RepID=UPI001FDF979C|nr:TetR/AcrR family transcriptional regulator [Amycolatopsis nigrescens]
MDLPAPPWQRTARRTGKPQLSQELVVRTALDILAAEGIDAVSMRRVATALGTGPASLYAHVSNKTELHDLMFDQVLAGVPLPEPDPERWDTQVKELLGGQLEVMLAHPGIARVAWETMVPVGAHALGHFETLMKLLRAGGLSHRRAVFAADALALYTKAFAYEGSVWSSGEVDLEETRRRSEQTWQYMSALPPDAFPNMLAAGDLLNGETAAERFTFGLDMMLRGLTRDE